MATKAINTLIAPPVCGFALGALILLASLRPGPANAEQFKVEFRDGTIATVDLPDQPIKWTVVSSSGQVTSRSIELGKLESLLLTESPASEQLVEIIELIRQLDSEDYWQREEAEAELKVLGKRYKKILSQEKLLTSSDAKYRLRRILNSMSTSKVEGSVDLDRAKFTNGQTVLGDAGELAIPAIYFGKTVDLDRTSIRKIYRPQGSQPTRPDKSETVKVQLFHDHVPFLKAGKVKLFEFEKDSLGRPLSKLGIVEVNDAWVDNGLVLGTEFPNGHVRVSSYEFIGKNRPVGGLSICNAGSKTSNTHNRFRGVMVITFCEPGARESARGVHQFGCFLAKVNRSRDFLLQAYDSMGNLLGVSEANHESCTFCGIKSSVPIAKIRILGNPWVRELRLREKWKRTSVDLDYAVDGLFMSEPVDIDSPQLAPHYQLRNGDYGLLTSAQPQSENEIEVFSRPLNRFQLKLEDTKSITFARASGAGPRDQWMIRTTNGSHLLWDPATEKSPWMKESFPIKDIVAIWPASTSARYPVDGDFDKGKNVVCFPGCRIATDDLKLETGQFSWTSGNRLEEDLFVEIEGREKVLSEAHDNVDPGKTKFSWEIRKLKQYQTPTIWLAPPTSLTADVGIVKLMTGEQIVYSNGGFFELKSLDRKEITFERNGNTIKVPIREVASIHPPQSQASAE